MKKILYAVLLAATTLGASSCNKDPKLPTPSVEEFPQIYTIIGTQSTYSQAAIQGSGSPTATITLDVRGDASQVEAIEVYRTMRSFNVPATGTGTVALGGPTVLLRTVSPASGDVVISVDDIIVGMTRPTGASQTGTRTAVTRASLRAGEGFLFTYALKLKSGRRIEYNASYNNAPFSGVVTIVP
jgi:hypothetical protein